MAIPPIPVKTPEGQAELTTRQRRVSQRHRTVLFLVDGRRSEQEVRTLAAQAGASESCFGELVDMGLIAVVQPVQPQHTPTVPIPRPAPTEDEPLHVDIPIEPEAPAPVPAPVPAPATPASEGSSATTVSKLPASGAPAVPHDEHESMLPAARTLHPESVLTESTMERSAFSESILQDFEALEASRSDDASLEEARGILIRAVRKESPVAGALTLMRLRRAKSRQELAELIDEVESRIVKPYRSLAAQQVLRRARHLLEPRATSPAPF